MSKTLSLMLAFIGVALAGISLFWPEGKTFLERAQVWIGWLVGSLVFVVFVIGDYLHARDMKKIRQHVGDYAQKIRSLRSEIEEQKLELSDKEKTLQKILDIDNFIINRVDVSEKATPRDSE